MKDLVLINIWWKLKLSSVMNIVNNTAHTIINVPFIFFWWELCKIIFIKNFCTYRTQTCSTATKSEYFCARCHNFYEYQYIGLCLKISHRVCPHKIWNFLRKQSPNCYELRKLSIMLEERLNNRFTVSNIKYYKLLLCKEAIKE